MDQRIDALQRSCATNRNVISLAGGLPSPALFPKAELEAAACRAVERDGDRVLQYDWPEGREDLRAFIARRLARRGAEVSPEDVIVTSGAQQAISIAARVLLGQGPSGGQSAPGGGRSAPAGGHGAPAEAPGVAMDPETYPGALDVFRACGAKVGPLAGARIAYTMPAIANPRGNRLSDGERESLLAWAGRTGGQIIEDDAYAELGFQGDPPPPLLARDRDHVWHAGTFSKTLAPGMRVGWLVPPPSQRARALEQKRLGDLQSSGLAQSVLAEFLSTDDFDARLAAARRHYERQAASLAGALRRFLPEAEFEEPAGGFSIWARLPGRGDDADLLAAAARAGVSFDPGSMFRSAPPESRPERLEMRLCYSLEPVARIEEGVRRLARVRRERR